MKLMKNNKIYVVIANSVEAKIYDYSYLEKNLTLLSEIFDPEGTLKTSELVSDEPGRYQKTIGPNQGTYAPHTDPHVLEKQKFAKMLAHELNKLDTQIIYKLFIFIPSSFQSLLKNQLEKPVLEKVTDFYDKNYLKLGIKELEKNLAEVAGLTF